MGIPGVAGREKKPEGGRGGKIALGPPKESESAKQPNAGRRPLHHNEFLEIEVSSVHNEREVHAL